MPSPAEENAPPSFEQSLGSLEEIVHELEDGQIGLAESLARYEQGVKLLKQCYELLQKAERRIELLTGVEPGGAAVTEPFDDSPTVASGSEPAANGPRSRRRSAKSAAKEPPGPPADDPSAMDAPRSLF